MESITWIQRRGQIKHLLYEMCLTGRIDKATLAEQFKDLNSVEPIKHGKWISDISGGYENICSICQHEFIDKCDNDSNYCPNCGARMDEVGNG